MARISRKSYVKQSEKPITARIYKTALYVRLSLEDIRKKNSDSIGTQKEMLMDFLQTQSDLQLYDIYEDVNYTGTNFNRPAFTQMMEDIQAGLVDCVVVKDLSRFGRNFNEAGHYLERVFPFLQVRFISLNDNYDSHTSSLDDSSLIVPLKNLMNEVYARDISKKTQSGKAAKQKRGEFCGAFAPYGYIKVGSSFVVDDEAASVVRQIYDWRLGGMGISAIVQKLNGLKILPPSRYRFEKGITSAKKHEETRFWYTSAVKRILSYHCYTGKMVSGRYKSEFLRGGGIKEVERDKWLVFENAHPAIIDIDTFEAVQRLQEAHKAVNAKKPTNTKHDNIFMGLIFCGDCGKHMARKQARKKHTYYCYIYSAIDKQACTNKFIREADLREAVYTHISREISIAADMNRIVSNLHKYDTYKNHNNTLDKRINAIKKKLEQNRRFRGSLREDFIDGILSEQDCTVMMADYDKEKDELTKELGDFIAEKQRQDTIASPQNKWLSELRRFETEQQLSRQMLKALVERIDIYDNMHIEITMRYRDEFEALRKYINEYDCEVKATNG